jgi:hypothetical protein
MPKNYMSINISRYQNRNIKRYESIANMKIAYLSETESTMFSEVLISKTKI